MTEVSDDLVYAPHKFRHQIPSRHRSSVDTRLRWLWSQRFGTVQTIYTHSPDLLDRTAATLILQAIMARDLVSIRQLYQRLEGGARTDETLKASSESLTV